MYVFKDTPVLRKPNQIFLCFFLHDSEVYIINKQNQSKTNSQVN